MSAMKEKNRKVLNTFFETIPSTTNVTGLTFKVIGDAGATSYLTLEEVLVHNLDLGEIIPNTVNGTFEVT